MSDLEVRCPSCGREIRFRREPRPGQSMNCPGCGTHLEVIGVSPLEVDWGFDAPIQEPMSDVQLEDTASEADVAAA
jgi:lysine biosynthesis protein LysW